MREGKGGDVLAKQAPVGRADFKGQACLLVGVI